MAPILRDIWEFDSTIRFVKDFDNKMADALNCLEYEFWPKVQHAQISSRTFTADEIDVYILRFVSIKSVSLDKDDDLLSGIAENPDNFVDCQHPDQNLSRSCHHCKRL